MTKLAPHEAVDRARTYTHAVVSYVDRDGFPFSVAGDFTVDGDTITVGPFDPGSLPADGQEVGLLFSHIRPQPGIGYDERRYVNCWGPARVVGDTLTVGVERATGWDEADVPFFEYAERTVPAARTYMAELGHRPRLSAFWTFFLTTRLPFLTATIVPVALGGAVAARHGGFSWLWFGLAMLGGILIHLGLNMANDLFDDASGADAANVTPTPFSGGSRVIQYGLVSRSTVVAATTACYLGGIAIGFYLAAVRGPGLLVIGAIGVLISLAYTAPPLRLVHRGVGELVTALGFGPVTTLGTYYACTGRISGEAIYISLPVALLIAGVLYVNEIPDRAGDAAVGKRTLPVRWTAGRVIGVYRLGVAAAFALIAAGPALGITPWWALFGLSTIPIALTVSRGLEKQYERPYDLMPSMQRNIALHFATGLLLLMGYVIDITLR